MLGEGNRRALARMMRNGTEKTGQGRRAAAAAAPWRRADHRAARRHQGLPRRPHGARPGLAGDQPRRVRLPRRPDRLRQVDPDQDPDPRGRRRPRAASTSPAATSARLAEKKIPQLRRNIGTVFQDFKLLPDRTVYDNVAYALQVIGASRAEIRRQVPETLRLVGLSTKLHNYPDQLSGGEQQRVSIARAFVNHPPLLLADEPSGNLDPVTSIGVMQLLYRINKTGTTVARRHPRPRDGRQHAPPRDRALRGPRRPRRGQRRLHRGVDHRVRPADAGRDGGRPRGPDQRPRHPRDASSDVEAPLLHPGGVPRPAPQRAPRAWPRSSPRSSP